MLQAMRMLGGRLAFILLWGVGLSGGCGGPAGAVDGGGNANQLVLHADWMLNAGEERYQCFLVRPSQPGGLRVRGITPMVGAAVHHIGVFTDDYNLEHRDTFECSAMGIWGFVYGAGIGTGALEFPAGTARTIDEGSGIILQMHYLNATNQPVSSSSTVTLQLADAAATLQPIGTWILGTTAIQLPPMQATNVDSTCVKHPKLENVFATFPHMHRLGTALHVTAGAGGATAVSTVQDWNFADQGLFNIAPTLALDENEPIQTRCSYFNSTAATVNFGLHSSDEMCVAVLYYWPSAGPSGLQLCGG
jgi:hypothetical protein